jgi:hypothetical protein
MLAKNFFKPNFPKILLTFLIFIFINFLNIFCSPYETHGLPSSGAGWHYPCGLLSKILFAVSMRLFGWGYLFNPIYLILCLMISYLISCGIFSIYVNHKSKFH